MTRQILAEGKRWLVIFPEGEAIWQNSILAPFQEGVVQLAFKAFEDAKTTDASAHPNLTPVLGRYFEREWSHGQGHRLYDVVGKAYLDFANGIAVTALGHVHPAVTAAIHTQVEKLIGPINAIGFTEPITRLAAELASTFPDPLDSVMFLNSGSEAIEGALKLARRVTGRPGIIAFRGGFHGRTFGAT